MAGLEIKPRTPAILDRCAIQTDNLKSTPASLVKKNSKQEREKEMAEQGFELEDSAINSHKLSTVHIASTTTLLLP